MIKVYIEQQGAPSELPQSLVFWPSFRFEISPKLLFRKEIIEQYKQPFFEIVSDIHQADFVAVPHEYFFAEKYAPAYLQSAYSAAHAAGKKVLLFDYTDFVDRTPKLPPHALFFRVSVYRHHKTEQEIVMPYFVEDFGKVVRPHVSKPQKAVVGFCGLSRYKSQARALKAHAKWGAFKLALILKGDALPGVHAPAVWWRRRAIQALTSSSAVETKIIERASYSLHRGSVSGDPEKIRADYRENMEASTLALSVRGDANASQRLYEALSCGRVPLFLDTDSVLPLEEVAPYEKCIIRVLHDDAAALPERAAAWHAEHTNVSFLEAESAAQALFRKYLRLDRYFEIVFDRDSSPYKKVLYGK